MRRGHRASCACSPRLWMWRRTAKDWFGGKLDQYTTRLDLLRTSELVAAARNRDWEKVEVRRPWRPLFTLNSVRGEPSVLALAREPLGSSSPVGFHRPCYAEPIPGVAPCPKADYDFACRRSSVPVTTSILETRALPCRHDESRDLSPLPSPEAAVSAPC